MMRELERFTDRARIAYFSMEIALRPEIHTYSGGLGVLAGDMARSCADLGLPLVFVTLASRAGYLRQALSKEGWQAGQPDPWDPASWATPLQASVAVDIEGRSVWLRAWLYVVSCQNGSEVPVVLIDTQLDQNEPADRTITDQLYGGDATDRLKQEIVLGIGGFRLLQALGFTIHKYHLNEGHAALLTLPLLQMHQRAIKPRGPELLGFDLEAVRERCIFTTHTPVEAGHDRFPYDLVARVMGPIPDVEGVKNLAGHDALNMTRLALNLSGYVNGVARRHAETAGRMFPGYHIQAVTNGVHVETWAHPSVAKLFSATIPNWRHEPECLVRADQLADAELATAHQDAKRELLSFVKDSTGRTLQAELPILGFARRMTGYKRPDLLFTNIARLQEIHRKRPFQIVLAGKAHPRDEGGKRLIRELHEHSRALAPEMTVIFIPDYDLDVAKRVVSGCDVWLNTPVPPLEASGTSGMKAGLNGVLNLSTLDGWWLEGWIEDVTGWAIGHDGENGDGHARELYDKLEHKVLPLYYDDRARWIWMMKQSMSKIGAQFNSHRMMRRYGTEAYL